MLILFILALAASLFLLWKGADWLVDGASGIAKALRISPMIIGLTIVAFATSMPEFIVSLFASLGGNGDLAVANVVGSNIANICLILGLAAVIYPLAIKSRTLINEFPFMLISGFLFLILANDNNLFQRNTFALGRIEGLIFLMFLALFIFYVYSTIKVTRVQKEVKAEFSREYTDHKRKIKHDILYFLIGIAMLIGGGRLLVYSGVNLAQIMGMSERVIGLTIVSIGTSLPELLTSVVVAIKKEADIAVGNVVGSNILNILMVLGVVSVISPIKISPSILYLDAVIMVMASFVLVFFATTGRKIVKWEGMAFLAAYAVYLVHLFGLF
ncbi:calcium/sodium antiporter [Candidatus Woesearchaeota archaeon]|nr:calcium/sodium antiporter [Candidatus Woesearchaeota archaeon]